MKTANAIKRFKRNKELFLLGLPAVLFIFVFSYIPMYGLVLPFFSGQIGENLFKSKFVGIQNFKYLFSNDALRITRNTVGFNIVFITLGLIFAVGFALLLFEMSSKFVRLYQTILFFPYFVSWVVASYIFMGLFDMDYGFLNVVIQHFGGLPVSWYMEPKYWLFILPAANLWKGVGYGTIIYYTALMGVDSELFEAAQLDGASKLQQVWTISIPMIKPIIIMITLMSIGGIIRSDFGLFFNVTRDSQALYPVTDVIDTYVYRALRKLGDLGMSSAAGLYQSVVGFILILISNWLVRKVDPENSLF